MCSHCTIILSPVTLILLLAGTLERVEDTHGKQRIDPASATRKLHRSRHRDPVPSKGPESQGSLNWTAVTGGWILLPSLIISTYVLFLLHSLWVSMWFDWGIYAACMTSEQELTQHAGMIRIEVTHGP